MVQLAADAVACMELVPNGTGVALDTATNIRRDPNTFTHRELELYGILWMEGSCQRNGGSRYDKKIWASRQKVGSKDLRELATSTSAAWPPTKLHQFYIKN